MTQQRIWAPWRIGYILGDKATAEPAEPLELLPGAEPHCFLCRCAPSGDDAARLVADRGKHSFTVLNRYPYNNGHLLIAPLRHCGRLDQLDDAEHLELVVTIRKTVGLLEKLLKPDGFNVGLNLGEAAGAGLPGHLHWHIVPRWSGDTSFMPSIAGIRVIPQSLEAFWELLRKELGGV